MHAYLIVSNNAESSEKETVNRLRSWKISVWDTIRIPTEGPVGIDLIRDFQRELALSPRNSPAKAGVLSGMDRLTVEAQNAMLKTLEEPPADTYIIGTTGNPEALLPTVRSRMSTIRLNDITEIPDTKLLRSLLTATPGKRLQMLEPFLSTRDDAKLFVVTLLGAARKELLTNPSPELTLLIRNLLAASSQLSVNVNQKLVVDNAVLSIP